MRVLVANIPLPENRFLVDLNAELEQRCEIVHDSDAFWAMEGDYDIVHLHFPEYLTFEIQDAYRAGLKDELIEQVRRRLEFWSERARIVVTRHVLLPHDAVSDPAWEKMYETVYGHADGVAHFAEPSVEEFTERYSRTVFHRGQPPAHVVIPHQNYSSLPSGIGRSRARAALGIPDTADVMLVFGAIRSDAERELVLNTFRAVEAPNKLLLVSRWRENLAPVSWIRLKYWIRDLTRLYHRFHRRYRFNYAFVEEADTQLYMEAADVLFIPRLFVLNSGNVTLGMTFGRVVVGPDSWDVGSLLRETGNPVFDPRRPETAGPAVDMGFQLAREGSVGRANRQLALTEWTAEQCAARYFDFFQALGAGAQAGATTSNK